MPSSCQCSPTESSHSLQSSPSSPSLPLSSPNSSGPDDLSITKQHSTTTEKYQTNCRIKNSNNHLEV